MSLNISSESKISADFDGDNVIETAVGGDDEDYKALSIGVCLIGFGCDQGCGACESSIKGSVRICDSVINPRQRDLLCLRMTIVIA